MAELSWEVMPSAPASRPHTLLRPALLHCAQTHAWIPCEGSGRNPSRRQGGEVSAAGPLLLSPLTSRNASQDQPGVSHVVLISCVT